MLQRNVLIFHLGALGDFVLTWPFAIALGRIYPQSRIIYVTHGQKGALAERVLRLESSDIEAGWHSLFAQGASLAPGPARLLGGAHAIYSFLNSTPAWDANIAALNPTAKSVALDPRVPEHYSRHATEWIAEQLQNYPVERSAMQQILRSVADRGIGFNRAAGPDVVIHPGSGSPAKCWPIENFIAVATMLRAAGQTVRWIIGEVEIERWSAADLAALEAQGAVRRTATYLQLLSEISTARVFIGNDSGPGHLAGIIGVPTLSLFGPTDPARWKPLGPHVDFLHNPSAKACADRIMDMQSQITKPPTREPPSE